MILIILFEDTQVRKIKFIMALLIHPVKGYIFNSEKIIRRDVTIFWEVVSKFINN